MPKDVLFDLTSNYESERREYQYLCIKLDPEVEGDLPAALKDVLKQYIGLPLTPDLSARIADHIRRVFETFQRRGYISEYVLRISNSKIEAMIPCYPNNINLRIDLNP